MGVFKGVTLNRNTKRFEACVWLADAAPVTPGRRSRGRQMYCGSYGTAAEAATAHDRVVLALYGCAAHKNLNFPADHHEAEVLYAEGAASVRARVMRDGRLAALNVSSSGFIGVSRKRDGFEARCHVGNHAMKRYSYLGTFGDAEEAARAYDLCALAHRGAMAVTNFEYTSEERSAYERAPPAEQRAQQRAERAQRRAEPRAELPVVMHGVPSGDETDLSDSE